MTSQDFAEVCEREGIAVIRTRLQGVSGAYKRVKGTPTIWIDSRLRGVQRVRTEFHELGHYFLHAGSNPSLWRMPNAVRTPDQDWCEIEAEACALLAIEPGFLLSVWIEVVYADVRALGWLRKAVRGGNERRKGDVR
jgi:Zn-dependent peptidase ImmA (M78 family)